MTCSERGKVMSRNGRLSQLWRGQRDKIANFVTLSRCAEHFHLTGKNTVKGINEGLFETVPGFVDGSFDGSTDILKLGIEEGS